MRESAAWRSVPTDCWSPRPGPMAASWSGKPRPDQSDATTTSSFRRWGWPLARTAGPGGGQPRSRDDLGHGDRQGHPHIARIATPAAGPRLKRRGDLEPRRPLAGRGQLGWHRGDLGWRRERSPHGARLVSPCSAGAFMPGISTRPRQPAPPDSGRRPFSTLTASGAVEPPDLAMHHQRGRLHFLRGDWTRRAARLRGALRGHRARPSDGMAESCPATALAARPRRLLPAGPPHDRPMRRPLRPGQPRTR